MQVVLRQDVENLGAVGEVVNVAAGYARNYLLPRKIAVPLTPANVREAERAREERRRREMVEMERIKDVASHLDGFLCPIPARATEKGHLFGSVGAEHISAALTESGLFGEIRATSVNLSRPLEQLGDTTVEIMLHPEVRVNITVRVVDELDMAAQEQ